MTSKPAARSSAETLVDSLRGRATAIAGRATCDSLGIRERGSGAGVGVVRGDLEAAGGLRRHLGLEARQGHDGVTQADARVVTDGEHELAVGAGCDTDGRDTRDASQAALEGRD